MDFSKYDYNNLTDVQLGELYTIADEAVSYPDASWEDQFGVHYFKIIDENDANFAYFDGVRIQIVREMIRENNQHLREVFSHMLGVQPIQIDLQKIEMGTYIFLHVRGTEDHELIKVRV